MIDQEIDWRLRVFDSLSYPTIILQPDRTIIAVNRRYLEKAGVEEDDIIGKSCRGVNLDHYTDQTFPCSNYEQCPLNRAIATRSGQSVLLKCHDVYGEEGWEERVFSPILGTGPGWTTWPSKSTGVAIARNGSSPSRGVMSTNPGCACGSAMTSTIDCTGAHHTSCSSKRSAHSRSGRVANTRSNSAIRS